jgi:predicted nucleic acid-binding protein
MYLDSAYIAKYYLAEPDSQYVREALADALERNSSTWAIPEVVCAFHRNLREGQIGERDFADLKREFLIDVESDVWHLIPVSDAWRP